MASGKLRNALGQIFYPAPYWPINSIFINTVNENPSKYFGGTWVSFGAGRCLVGVDTSQTEFNSVEKAGGSKYLQKHSHMMGKVPVAGWVETGDRFGMNNYGGWAVGDRPTEEEGTGTSGNLQPYITVYFWKRTA